MQCKSSSQIEWPQAGKTEVETTLSIANHTITITIHRLTRPVLNRFHDCSKELLLTPKNSSRVSKTVKKFKSEKYLYN